MAEFAEDKQATIDAEQPKDIDLTVPGWGSWGGEGIELSKKIRKRYGLKACIYFKSYYILSLLQKYIYFSDVQQWRIYMCDKAYMYKLSIWC